MGQSSTQPGVRLSTLSNGMRLVTHEMPHVESASLGVWVGAGTRHEAAEVNGISHLLEHMAFKGTERRSARDIAEEIEAVGGHLNAYTAREQTAYFAKVLKDDTALALDIVSDILQHPTFEADELAREQDVVLQEIGQSEDTPDDIIFDHFQTTAYPDQPVGRPVLGTPEIVKSLDAAALRAYMAHHYTTENMVFSAAGNVDHDRMGEMVEKAFADLPTGQSDPAEDAKYVGGDFREHRDLEQVHMILGFDGVDYFGKDYYASSVLSSLLGGGMSSRLFQEVREKRGLVYSIFSYATSYHDGGLFSIYAGTGPKDIPELVPVVCDEIAKLANGIGADEIRRAKAQIKAGLLMSLESSSGRCEQIARQVLAYGEPHSIADLVANVEAVDEGMLIDLSKRLFAGTPTLALLGPDKGAVSYDDVRHCLNG